MKVLVYVEGPSDQAALRALLRSLLADGQRRGVGIQFLPLGDKAKILNTSAGKAARHLAEHPEDRVSHCRICTRWRVTMELPTSIARLRILRDCSRSVSRRRPGGIACHPRRKRTSGCIASSTISRCCSWLAPDYIETVDAPWILERASLDAVLARCPQCFVPFVNELRQIIESAGSS
jgi:hypothetical protein